jgi:membrane protease YdiL (CAAX protease family)
MSERDDNAGRQDAGAVPGHGAAGFPWGPWATLVWCLVIAVATLLAVFGAGLLAIFVDYILLQEDARPRGDAAMTLFFSRAVKQHFALLTAVQSLAMFAMVWLLTRPRGGLSRIRMLRLETIAIRRCALWAIQGLAVIFALDAVIGLVLQINSFDALKWIELLKPKWLAFLVIVLIAPIAEEVLFRGFVYGGLAPSAIGPVGAILFSTIVWTALHTQYPWPVLVQVFMYGLVFGAMRWQSGSLWPSLIAHCLFNLAVFVLYQAGFFGP